MNSLRRALQEPTPRQCRGEPCASHFFLVPPAAAQRLPLLAVLSLPPPRRAPARPGARPPPWRAPPLLPYQTEHGCAPSLSSRALLPLRDVFVQPRRENRRPGQRPKRHDRAASAELPVT